MVHETPGLTRGALKAGAIPGLVRPFTLLAPVVGVGSGAVIAHAATDASWAWDRLAFALGSAMLATAASNAWNQVFDVELDRVNKPSRPLPSGRIGARAAMGFGHACAVGALLLAWLATPAFLACVAVGIVFTWIYSAPPLRLKRSAVGALVAIAIPRGLLVPVAGWSVLASPWTAEPWTLGAAVGLFVLGAAATKDFADVTGDCAHGCRTLPVVFGARRAAQVVAPFLVAPFLLYPVGGMLGLLQPPAHALWLLAGVLMALGAATAVALLRDPDELARRGANHPAWAGMYLLMIAAHVGSALVYVAA
jgi:4-hydroxybenzoate polyprenyltransferase